MRTDAKPKCFLCTQGKCLLGSRPEVILCFLRFSLSQAGKKLIARMHFDNRLPLNFIITLMEIEAKHLFSTLKLFN